MEEGFGYTDIMDVEQKKQEWVIEGVLPKGFGFLAGPPKAGNSPHGGKSFLSRAMLLSVISGGNFLNIYPAQKGEVLIVNLDESQYAIKDSVLKLAEKKLQCGIKVSNAISLSLPRDIEKLEADVDKLRPSILIVDPLLRTLGGKEVGSNASTGPIIDEFRRIQKQYDMTVMVIHHPIKKIDREKETTATWLSGSGDLDSAWDFCLCLEWDRGNNKMHLRCFYRYSERKDIYYVARKDGDTIVGFELVSEKGRDLNSEKVRACLEYETKTVKKIAIETNLNEASVKRALYAMPGYVEIKGKCGKAAIWGLVKQDTVQGISEQKNSASVQEISVDSEQK